MADKIRQIFVSQLGVQQRENLRQCLAIFTFFYAYSILLQIFACKDDLKLLQRMVVGDLVCP